MWLTHATFKLGDKIWLETHIWHTKRMKMETLWGYRLVRLAPSYASQSLHLMLGAAPYREGLPLFSQSFQVRVYLTRCILPRDHRSPWGPSSSRVLDRLLLRILSKPWVNTLSHWCARL
jgi:hypothetical protein